MIWAGAGNKGRRDRFREVSSSPTVDTSHRQNRNPRYNLVQMISEVSKHHPPLRVVDLFAGAGGFSLGFGLAGFELVGAIEQDQWAAETLKFNHPNARTLVSDIEDLTDEEIYQAFAALTPDVVLGGPPCQGFSVCRRSTSGDPSDPRNSLFEQFLRVARLLNPSVVLMENVPNLTKAKTHNNELVLDIIRSEMEKLGYFVDHAVLEATEFGVPQIRRRLFILGSKTKIEEPFPRPTHYVQGGSSESLFDSSLKPCPHLWDAISDLPELSAGAGDEEIPYRHRTQTEYQKVMRGDCQTLYNHRAMNHTRRMVSRFAAMSCGHSVSDVPDHLRPFKRNSNGVISEKTYDQNNRRMYPYRPCHTIPASFFANFVHPFQHRNFTAREGARIQSFPDSYVFKGKPTVISHKLLGREGRLDEKYLCQYSQIGNAVPPLLAKAIALHLRNRVFNEERQCSFTATI
jgi:DNA (cytosine-5)-methyltransferase 1